MDQNEFSYHYGIPKINVFNPSFPYFTSTENQTLYVLVPTVNTRALNQIHETVSKTEAYFSEEEILPDFRCKICSETIFNYPDFKIHQQEHEEKSEKSFLLENDRIQGLEIENSRSKSDHIKKNIDFGAISDSSKWNLDLGTINKNTNLMPENKVLSFETSSNSLLENYKRHLPSSESFVIFNDSTIPLNSLKLSICAKSGEPFQIQSKKLDLEIQKSNVVKFPLTQILNKCGSYTLTSKLPNPVESVYPFDKESFEDKLVTNNGIMNSSLTNNLHFPNVALQESFLRQNNIPIAEPSTSNITPTLTYTHLKELSTTFDKNRNTPSYACSSLQNSLIEQNTKGSTELKKSNLDGIFLESFTEKGTDQMTGKSIDSVSTTQPLDDMSKSIPIYSNTEISTKYNTRNKTVKYSKNRTPDISPLKFVNKNDRGASILKPLIDAKRKSLHSFPREGIFQSHSPTMTKHLADFYKTKYIYCVLCKSSFASLSSLRKHLLMSHCESKDRRQCSYCDYRCFQTSDLEKHISRRHTRNFKYKCNLCIKGYTTPKELNDHLRKKH